MKKKILISGGHGSLGKTIKSDSFLFFRPKRERLDVTSYESIDHQIRTIEPDYFIHAAALTRPYSPAGEFTL